MAQPQHRVSFEGYGGSPSGGSHGAPSPAVSLDGVSSYQPYQQQQPAASEPKQHWAAGLVDRHAGVIAAEEADGGYQYHHQQQPQPQPQPQREPSPALPVEVGPPSQQPQRPQPQRPASSTNYGHYPAAQHRPQQPQSSPPLRPSLYSPQERRLFPNHRPPQGPRPIPHLSGLEAGHPPIQYPYQPPPSLAQYAYARTARGVSERGGEDGRRWNPILGGFVRAATAEEDIREEVHSQDVTNFEKGMARLMAREGEYDPIFWRHRRTKEAAALPPRTQGPRLVPRAPADTIAETLRMSDNQEEFAAKAAAAYEQRRQLLAKSGAPGFYRGGKHLVDHVRGLLCDEPDPNDSLVIPVPPDADGNRHYPVPNREYAWGQDHVKELIRGDCPSDNLLIMHDNGRPCRKANAAFHHTRREPTDFCVANLLSEEKARRLPLPPPALSPYKRTPLGDRMRSGEDVRVVLHPYMSPEELGRCPYDVTDRLHGQPQARHQPADRNPYRRPQFAERTQWGQHQAAAQQMQQHQRSGSAASDASLSSSSNPPHPIARDPLPPPTAAMAALTMQQQQRQPGAEHHHQGRRDSLASAPDEALVTSAFVAGGSSTSSSHGGDSPVAGGSVAGGSYVG